MQSDAIDGPRIPPTSQASPGETSGAGFTRSSRDVAAALTMCANHLWFTSEKPLKSGLRRRLRLALAGAVL
jgi:hypothetical protein